LKQEAPIYYLGPEHSFHHIIALRVFGESPALTPVENTEILGSLLADNPESTGVLAIHNTVAGYLPEHYHIIANHHLFIRRQVELGIQLHLCGLPGTSVLSLRTIGSHPVALQQCSIYLQGMDAKQVAFSSTSAAMQQVREQANPEFAAIGNQQAAREAGLSILASSIQNQQDTTTRFAILSKKRPHTTKQHGYASIWIPFSAIPIANLFMSKNHMQVLGNLALPQHHAVVQEVKLQDDGWRHDIEEELLTSGARLIGLYGESTFYNEF
jgi:prephenate dehydratase